MLQVVFDWSGGQPPRFATILPRYRLQDYKVAFRAGHTVLLVGGGSLGITRYDPYACLFSIGLYLKEVALLQALTMPLRMIQLHWLVHIGPSSRTFACPTGLFSPTEP